MSIPVTMRALYSRLKEITSLPLSTSHPATTEAEDHHLSPVMDTDGQLPEVSQSGAMPEQNSVPGSTCGAISVAKSELHPEINASMPVDPYPFVPVVEIASCQS